MQVARLELCKELYKLSGWDKTDYMVNESSGELFKSYGDFPAYDLGYLLRKLPSHSAVLKLEFSYLATSDPTDKYLAKAAIGNVNSANTPEDATAKLCIELFKQGILK